MNRQQAFFARFCADIQPGTLQWIGLRPARREAMVMVDEVQAHEGLGLEGDRRCKAPHDTRGQGSARQVSLINAEHIEAVAKILGKDSIDPGLLRRNLVISGLNLQAIRYQRFQIGEAIFEATALCHPCSRMDKNLGPGGHAAMLGHGGLCAKVIQSGVIRIGDPLVVLPGDSA